MSAQATAAVDLGKSRCRVVVHGIERSERSGIGAPGLAAADGVASALDAILPLLAVAVSVDLIGVGAAGAWIAQELASRLARTMGARVAVASDVVTAHAGALDGGPGALLIAGTGAAALGIASVIAVARVRARRAGAGRGWR